MGNKFVRGRPERWMSRQGSILGSVDVALRMLDANAHGKGLLCEGHVVVLKELKNIASRMPAGEDEVLCLDWLVSGVLGRLDINTGDGARRVDANVDELRSITDDTSELLDALGYSGDNRGKDVGANVRLGIPQNIAGRTRLDEGFEDKAMGGIFCSRIELAVREGPRAAQTKLDITLGVEDALL